MSTTYILEPADDPADDLDSFMAELDRDLKKDRSSANKAKKPVVFRAPEPPIVQQWFPNAVVMHATNQNCTHCGNSWSGVTGIYLEDLHRNGATRKQLHVGGTIPPDYTYLEHRVEVEETTIPYCPECFETPDPAPLEPPAEPSRAAPEE